jgi:glyoxylate reductase
MKTYIVCASSDFADGIKNGLEENGLKNVSVIIARAISPEELGKQANDCEILIATPSGFDTLSRDHINLLPQLKFISTTSVGVDWVDLGFAKRCGVTVSNQKGVNSESVAEHCFGLILDLAKKITESDRGIREKGEYRQSAYSGKEIYGKTIGIIGLGDVGQRVARIARGFDMKILGINKSKRKVFGVELVSLETLLKESDIIAVTVSLSPETENLLAEKEFKIMKAGVIVASISKEKVINKQAIIDALGLGKVFGYGFDAEIMSPIEKNDAYQNNSKIIITPHTASVTEETSRGYVNMTIENVKAFLNGAPIRIVSI